MKLIKRISGSSSNNSLYLFRKIEKDFWGIGFGCLRIGNITGEMFIISRPLVMALR